MQDQETKPVETEEISVNDTPITIERQADDTLTVHLPEGLTDEAKAALQATIETGEVSSLVKAWHRKNQELNQEKAKFEEIKATLQNPVKQEEQPKQATETPDTLWKRLGLESEADLEDYEIEHQREYNRMVAKITAEQEIATFRKQQELELDSKLTKQKEEFAQSTLVQSIKAQGIDPIEVQAFAIHYGMPFSDGAFTLYRQVHADKSNPVLRAVQEAQKNQINYIPQAHYRQKGVATEAEVKLMSDEELQAYLDYRKEQVQREG